jgi:hypothetical protein
VAGRREYARNHQNGIVGGNGRQSMADHKYTHHEKQRELARQ